MENVRVEKHKTLKYWGFLFVCAAVLVVLLTGTILKFTVLRDRRTTLMYEYKLTYTILVSDLDEKTADMFVEGMGIYLDDTTVGGQVSRIRSVPAASGQTGLQDLTLYVNATASSLSEEIPESTTFSDAAETEFQGRFLSFTGKITSMEVES